MKNFRWKNLRTGRLSLAVCMISALNAHANIIPMGDGNNNLYYKVGGAGNYAMPPVSNTESIALSAGADFSGGYQCGMFNPAVSIQNSMNSLEDSSNNLTQSIVSNATGSVAEMPMYFLAQANPTLYNMMNNSLFNANTDLNASVKSCEQVKSEIAKGQNPYQDWANISVGDTWKKELSLTAEQGKDMNTAKKEVDKTAGDDGVAWVQGKQTSIGARAGGKGQPVIHVVADTVKSGYNAILRRDLTSNAPAPDDSALYAKFPTPKAASDWATNVLGDQNITTCIDASCLNAQGGMVGTGLTPWLNMCSGDKKDDCVEYIRERLGKLVSGTLPVTKENLLSVSAEDQLISPKLIQSMRLIDKSQQGIIVNKLAQEIAVQRLIDKALMLRTLLKTGSQVPVIAVNEPAQKILNRMILQLDSEMQNISFESDIRKKFMSNTASKLIEYADRIQQGASGMTPVSESEPIISSGAIKKERN